jgi:GntR family transcriptional regulator
MGALDPLYKHVKQQIVASLSEGEWKPGEMMPSEPVLAARYQVGISTIRAALAELATAGVVVRRQGKGTYVGVHGEQRSVYRFFHVVRDGAAKELPVSELLDFRKGVADDQAADQLELPRQRSGRAVFRIRNVLRAQGVPVVVSDVVIPAAVFPRLTGRLAREGGPTLYAVYQRHFGVTITRAVEEIRSRGADATAAKVFGLRPGAPVLEVRRVAYSFGNRPVEVRRSQVDTRRHHYRIDQGDEI